MLSQATRAAAKFARRARPAATAAFPGIRNATRIKAAPATVRGAAMHFVIKLSIALVLPAFVAPEPFPPLATVTYTAAVPAPIVPIGETFACTPTAVWDGDGPIWCAEGPKVRIAGVAAREMDGSCRSNHPCPSVGALEARDRLVRILGGPRGTLSTGHVKVRSGPMQCVSDGSARGSRTAAWCHSPVFGDLSCAVVRAGGAMRWPRYWKARQC